MYNMSEDIVFPQYVRKYVGLSYHIYLLYVYLNWGRKINYIFRDNTDLHLSFLTEN